MEPSKETLHSDPSAIACDAAKALAGGANALAKKLGVKHQVVYGWTRVPPKWVLRVEKETGISRHKLRPDVFGPAPDSKEAAA